MNIFLFGAQARELEPIVARHSSLSLSQDAPDAIVCYGGDGTLLEAERRWPGIPKAPIRNSRRGNRCIAHPAPKVIERLARGDLARAEYLKLECRLRPSGAEDTGRPLVAMNEFNAHMAKINSAVRFQLWLDDEPYAAGQEILGDGFVISTPFGSTAYFNHITRGFFHTGIGIAFKSTSEHTNHVVVPENTVIRLLVTRGPALLAYDNCPAYQELESGDEIRVERSARPAVILTWSPMKYPSDAF